MLHLGHEEEMPQLLGIKRKVYIPLTPPPTNPANHTHKKKKKQELDDQEQPL